MAQRIASSLLVSLLVVTLIVPSPVAVACGPSFAESIFIESDYPDLPLDKYAAGNLGIVQPSYAPSFLVVAYRYFSGKGFDASEHQQLVSLWSKELYSVYGENSDPQKAGDGGFPIYAKVNSSSYESYANCLEDAYRTAEKTRADRSKEFGPDSAAFASWSDAQDAVFRNCSGGDSVLPEAADPSLPPIIRKDREYQIAAAYFYNGNWDEAKKRFQAIASDSSSPWKVTAGLVAARCDIRAATLGPDDTDKHYAAADAQLRKIIADPEFGSVKASAERLRGFVEFRTDPKSRLLELSNAIERRMAPEALENNLSDYAQLVRTPFGLATSPRERGEMTDWICSFGQRCGRDTDTEARRVMRWENTRSLAWLVAALTYAQVDTPQLAELLDAAGKVPATSPAYLTAAFQRDRLLVTEGKEAQVRGEIDKVLRMPRNSMTPSARNLFLALRMKVARNLDEFLQFAPRQAVDVNVDSHGDCKGITDPCPPPAEPEFDADAARELSQMIPARLGADAAASSRLPTDLRRQVAQSVWTRSIMLGEEQTALQLAPVLSSLAPDLAAGLKAYAEAPTGSTRTFAGVFLILHQPGLRPYVYAGAARQTPTGDIDEYRDNWWCDLADRSPSGWGAYPRLRGVLTVLYPGGAPSSPQFLSENERREAQKEDMQIIQLGAGLSWLAQQVLSWAKTHPEDAHVPEALHLVVVATHLGCGKADSGSYSKAAFELLHKRYPKSVWTARTPYWYN
jgi:hypothetical protein